MPLEGSETMTLATSLLGYQSNATSIPPFER